jgi:thymidylate kinase
MAVAGLVDSVLSERVLVFGSPPPEGADLDLLARPAAQATITDALSRAGFVHRAGQWASFRSCSVDVVELIPVTDWRLPAAERERLFDDALSWGEFEHLVLPAPHHLLLIFARDLLYDGSLGQSERRRLARGLAENPGAWERAQVHASGWGVTRALPALRAAYENGAEPPAAVRARGLAELLGDGDRPAALTRARAWRGLARRRPRGRIIAVSGLDGSGKSTQVEALREALVRLGYDAAVEWTRLEASTLRRGIFDLARVPTETVLRLTGRLRTSTPSPAEAIDEAAARRRLRERSWLLTQLWVAFVTLLHIAAQRRAVAGHLRAGRVVVCDRYALDVVADLRFHYGRGRRFRLQALLIRMLSHDARRRYFLDVSPETALARTTEPWTAQQLAELAGLFREHYARMGYQRLDGERPQDELCREIALDAWMSLRGS